MEIERKGGRDEEEREEGGRDGRREGYDMNYTYKCRDQLYATTK